jgi:hypothetical protein
MIMRDATWTMIQGNPVAMRLWRAYRRLPGTLRIPLRWAAFPTWEIASALVKKKAGDRIMAGPFKGMIIRLSSASSRDHLAYLLGTQELELFPTIKAIVAGNRDSVINIGAADGYYAVGFAWAMPETRVIAFEALAEHHERFWQTAEANNVADRVALHGFCTPADLRETLSSAGPQPLVLCDIEGGELTLLDNRNIPELDRAEILVETHDDMAPGCSNTLCERFARTHTITSILAQPRRLADFPSWHLPFVAKWMPRTALELMNERRTSVQEWLHLVPISSKTD